MDRGRSKEADTSRKKKIKISERPSSKSRDRVSHKDEKNKRIPVEKEKEKNNISGIHSSKRVEREKGGVDKGRYIIDVHICNS